MGGTTTIRSNFKQIIMSINVSRDYKDMIEDRYINNKGIFTLEINKLQEELKQSTSVEDTLRKIDNLNSYKRVLDMKINFQNIKDKKYPDNLYIHARGSLTLGPSKRLWISHYTGKENEVTDKMREQARLDVMKKAIKTVLK
jgi:hypothetical protein